MFAQNARDRTPTASRPSVLQPPQLKEPIAQGHQSAMVFNHRLAMSTAPYIVYSRLSP